MGLTVSRKTAKHLAVRRKNEKILTVSRYKILKNWAMLSVRISSYGCTREVWRARKKRKSCSRR